MPGTTVVDAAAAAAGDGSRRVPMTAATRLKWALFRTLERLSDLRGNNTAGQFELTAPDAPAAALWVFVSTIGELNAIDPFLRELARRKAAATN